MTLGCLAVLAFALTRYEECFRNPSLIFWWFGVPLSVGLLALAFLAVRGPARLGLASMILVLSLVETGFYSMNRWREPDVESYIDPEYYQGHPLLGYGPKRGITSHAWKKLDGTTLYDVEYTIDELGRRVTPVVRREGRRRFLLFFGGSFMFGEGVGDRETLPFFAGQQASREMPYNYGFHGYGPQQLLAELESDELRAEVTEGEGSLVYLFIDAHVNRAIGSMVVYTGWADAAPHYVLDGGGRPVRRGNFTTGRAPTALLYSIVGRSQVLKYFRLDVPFVITGRHMEFTARIFARASSLFQEQFGRGRFIVVIFPGSAHAARLARELRRVGVDRLDYSQLLDFEDAAHHIRHDYHPSARTYRLIADQLVQDLGIGGSSPVR
jgi:hypothetical protein